MGLIQVSPATSDGIAKPRARCRRPSPNLRSSAASFRNIPVRNRRSVFGHAAADRAPQSYPTASPGVSGGGQALRLCAAGHPPLEATGTVAPRSVAAKPAPAHAGTTIIVGTSDTLETLSRRYNVSSAAILQANGYKGPRALSPGQQLIIPRQTAAVAAPAVAAPALTVPASKVVAAPAAPTVHVVNRGDTLLSIARRNQVPVAALAKANGLDARPNSSSARRSPYPLEDRGGSPTGAAGRCCRRAARRRIGAARDQNGCRDKRSAAKRAAGPGHHQG
jgi:LysM repeat protein